MDELTLTTPALCFSALSLLLLAYTNRFMGYAQLVRSLYANYQENKERILLSQITNLRKRLKLIRDMQLYGVGSLFLCVCSMLSVYFEIKFPAIILFGLALVGLIISLAISFWEICISVVAVNLHLNLLEENEDGNKKK